MAPVPLAKLVGLLIKTLAKPVSKQIRHQFVKQPITRRSLIWVGQASHAATTRMTMSTSAKGSISFKVRSVPKIEDKAALSQGADLLSESFLFAVSGGLAVYEYNRSSAKEKKKEAARLQAIRDDASRLQAKLVSLDKRLVALEAYAKTNRPSVLGIELGATGEYVEPGEVVPMTDEGGGNTAILNEKERTQNPHDSQTLQKSETQRTWKWWRPF